MLHCALHILGEEGGSHTADRGGGEDQPRQLQEPRQRTEGGVHPVPGTVTIHDNVQRVEFILSQVQLLSN